MKIPSRENSFKCSFEGSMMMVKIDSWSNPRRLFSNRASICVEIGLESCDDCEACTKRIAQVKSVLSNSHIRHFWNQGTLVLQNDSDSESGSEGLFCYPIEYLSRVLGKKVVRNEG